MATTNEYLNQLQKDKQNLVDNLNDKGVTASNIETFTSLVPKVLDIQSSSSTEYPLNEDMEWAKQICIDDIQEGFSYKTLEMLSDCYICHNIEVPSGGAVKTSDGAYYTSNAKHTWDDTNAKIPQSYKNIKLRWIITYYPNENSEISLFSDVIYVVINGIKHNNQCFVKKYNLEYFDYINGASYTGNSFSYIFANCCSLKSIPLIDTSKITDFSYAFQNCYSLEFIPEIDTSSATNFNSTFYECTSLKTIPSLNLRLCKNFVSAFFNCKSLLKIPEIDTSSATSLSTFFQYCYSLQVIEKLDFNSATNVASIFRTCDMLEFLNIININVSFDISSSNLYSRETLLNLINNLVDLNGENPKTFTMGNSNLTKLNEEDKLIATNKNWILA